MNNIPEEYRLKNTIKYPTSIIVGGLNKLGFEIADSLIEQGGYVIIVDSYTKENVEKLRVFPKDTLISFLDYTSIPHLDEELRRLDYIFYFSHESQEYLERVSTQEFLTYSNYLDNILALSAKFEAKFLLTTAIKAHQLDLTYQELGGADNSTKHKIYNSVEIQKYSESLTFEYADRLNLDARIIRLGEMIGDGVDFTHKSVFTELILQGVNGQNLKLKKDGLETDWFINMQDAAYGLIKAQFSKGTQGGIYSLCYEHPYSHLSIAYKIQELEGGAVGIEFIDEKDNLPALRLYKPAPNLSQIGWIPKISFEKSVSQSLAAAKIYLIEQTTKSNSNDSNKSVVGKLKNFLAIAKAQETQDSEESGPISRLISQRKEQEELKRLKLDMAGDSIKSKRKRKPRTFLEKTNLWIWKNITDLGNAVTFLKYKSPLEIAAIFVFVILLVVLYFTFLSPTLSLTRNVLVTYPKVQTLIASQNASDFQKTEEQAKDVKSSLEEIKAIFQKYKSFANVLALEDEYDQSIELLDNYILYAEGVEDLGYGSRPYFDYLENYQNNTQLRTSTDGFIAANNNNKSYEDILLELENRAPYINLGIEKINRATNNIDKSAVPSKPAFLSKELTKINTDLKNKAIELNSLESSIYFPEVLGIYASKTYLVLALDNTRQTPVGGEISAYALITITNGNIQNINVQSVDEVNFDLSSVDANILNQINSRKFTYVTLDTLSVNDIANIQNYSTFSSVASNIWADTFDTKVSGVITMNLNSMDLILKSLESDKSIKIDNVEFTDGEILSNIESAQGVNPSLKTKHRVIAQILANLIAQSTDDLGNIIPIISKNASISTNNADILVEIPETNYNHVIKANDLNLTNVYKTDSYATLGINLTDSRVSNLDNFLTTYVISEVEVDNTLNLNYTLNFQFPNVGVSQEVSICLPIRVKQASIKVDSLPSDRVVINTNNDERCVVAQILTEEELTVRWQLEKVFALQETQLYNLELGTSKVRGTFTNYSSEILLDESISFKTILPAANQQGNVLFYSAQNISGDQLTKISFEK